MLEHAEFGHGGAFGSGNDSGFGTVFELSPGQGGWIETILYNFAGGNDGADPRSTLVFDSQGNLYGTTFEGGESRICNGFGCGTAFRLSPTEAGEWSESLFRFSSDQVGLQPTGLLLLDSAGIVYGTTTAGGAHSANAGVVFRILP